MISGQVKSEIQRKLRHDPKLFLWQIAIELNIHHTSILRYSRKQLGMFLTKTIPVESPRESTKLLLFARYCLEQMAQNKGFLKGIVFPMSENLLFYGRVNKKIAKSGEVNSRSKVMKCNNEVPLAKIIL